jgi:predicted chitinase/peptidoglycan hydrolase-like protein with peptidoglycan-binding domain
MPRAIDIVRMVAPKAVDKYSLAFEGGDPLLEQHGIATPLRMAHFLAQVLHETGALTVERESGNYSARRLLEVFGVGRHSAGVAPAEAAALAALSPLARKEEAIFERVYGVGNPTKANELGNIHPGDGYRYRGGGILQTTGRSNYRRMGQKCGVDFEAHPELVVSAEHALKPALAEWTEGNLNSAADRDDLIAITKRINGGLNGLEERRTWLAKLKPLIKSVRFVDRGIFGGAAGLTPTGEVIERPRGTGAGLLTRAREHIGERYDHELVPKDDPNWKGPWDCAEFISWLVFQETGILYGCLDDNAKPHDADAYTGGWRRDVEQRGIRVSVDKASATVGGIVLRYPPPGGMGHVALCDGKGGTIEAKGKKFGVVADTVHGRPWDTGVLIPGIKYDSEADAIVVRPPTELYARNAPNMDKVVIIEIQKALMAKGFGPLDIDGEFGPDTESTVVAFQNSEGLVVDGQVGPDTARALGISLTGAKPTLVPTAPPIQWPWHTDSITEILNRLKNLENVMIGSAKSGVPGTPGAPAIPQIDLARIEQDIARLGQIAATFSQFANQVGHLPTAGLPPQVAQIEQSISRLGQIAGTLSQITTALSGPAPAVYATAKIPPLSPIDKLLGGEALVGLKTPLAIGAYALLWVLQAANVVGTATGDKATTTGSVLTALISAFGAMGVTAKFDRAFQALSTISALLQKLPPPLAQKTDGP